MRGRGCPAITDRARFSLTSQLLVGSMLLRWFRLKGRAHPVRRKDDLGLAQIVEPVQLVQQLHERALDLAIGRRALAEPPASDRVNLVHEDDARFVLFRVAKHLADQARRLANVLVDDRRRDDLEEVRRECRRDRAREQRLAGTGRTVQEDTWGSRQVRESGIEFASNARTNESKRLTFRRLDSDSHEQLRVHQG